MLKTSLIMAAMLATTGAAFAQQPPSAGGQLRQIPPAPRPERTVPEVIVRPQAAPAPLGADGARVRVNALRVTGATLFSESELIAAARVTPGSDATLEDLREAAARIAAFYNNKGYFLAQAYVPAQDVAGGAVTLAVVEGRYGQIDIRNRARLHESRAAGLLSGLESGQPVAHRPLERRLLLLSDIPGVRVTSTLAPGSASGPPISS
jgi:hemolysin activation/secretion protein